MINRYVIVLVFQLKVLLSKFVVTHDVCRKLRTQDHTRIIIYDYSSMYFNIKKA